MCCWAGFFDLWIVEEDHISNLYLIRHGQASFGEKNYDNLSKKGVKQSIVLGKKLLKQKISFDKTIIGPLKRHQQTFDGINQGMVEIYMFHWLSKNLQKIS